MKLFSKLAYWYFTKGALPYWCIFIIDCIIFVLSGLFVYAVSHGTLLTLQTFWTVTATLSFYLLFYIVGFRLFHTYAGIIRSSLLAVSMLFFTLFRDNPTQLYYRVYEIKLKYYCITSSLPKEYFADTVNYESK